MGMMVNGGQWPLCGDKGSETVDGVGKGEKAKNSDQQKGEGGKKKK